MFKFEDFSCFSFLAEEITVKLVVNGDCFVFIVVFYWEIFTNRRGKVMHAAGNSLAEIDRIDF